MELLTPEAIAAIARVIDLLANAQYEEAASRRGETQGPTADELKRVVQSYGRTLRSAPADEFPDVGVYALQNKVGTLAVDFPLCTLEEGRSDLTLCVRVLKDDGEVIVEIEDLRVL